MISWSKKVKKQNARERYKKKQCIQKWDPQKIRENEQKGKIQRQNSEK